MKVRTITNWNGTNPQRYVKAEIAEALLTICKETLDALEFLSKVSPSTLGEVAIDKVKTAIKKAEE